MQSLGYGVQQQQLLQLLCQLLAILIQSAAHSHYMELPTLTLELPKQLAVSSQKMPTTGITPLPHQEHLLQRLR
jgi:hypothetical protein